MRLLQPPVPLLSLLDEEAPQLLQVSQSLPDGLSVEAAVGDDVLAPLKDVVDARLVPLDLLLEGLCDWETHTQGSLSHSSTLLVPGSGAKENPPIFRAPPSGCLCQALGPRRTCPSSELLLCLLTCSWPQQTRLPDFSLSTAAQSGGCGHDPWRSPKASSHQPTTGRNCKQVVRTTQKEQISDADKGRRGEQGGQYGRGSMFNHSGG